MIMSADRESSRSRDDSPEDHRRATIGRLISARNVRREHAYRNHAYRRPPAGRTRRAAAQRGEPAAPRHPPPPGRRRGRPAGRSAAPRGRQDDRLVRRLDRRRAPGRRSRSGTAQRDPRPGRRRTGQYRQAGRHAHHRRQRRRHRRGRPLAAARREEAGGVLRLPGRRPAGRRVLGLRERGSSEPDGPRPAARAGTAERAAIGARSADADDDSAGGARRAGNDPVVPLTARWRCRCCSSCSAAPGCCASCCRPIPIWRWQRAKARRRRPLRPAAGSIAGDEGLALLGASARQGAAARARDDRGRAEEARRRLQAARSRQAEPPQGAAQGTAQATADRKGGPTAAQAHTGTRRLRRAPSDGRMRMPAGPTNDYSFMQGCWRTDPFKHETAQTEFGISSYCFDANGNGSLEWRRGRTACRTRARARSSTGPTSRCATRTRPATTARTGTPTSWSASAAPTTSPTARPLAGQVRPGVVDVNLHKIN